MSGIAKLLLRKGARVSGSDLKESRLTKELQEAGAKVYLGHTASNVEGADIVVYSSAIKEGNPEVQEAKARGIPLIQRAQALAQLMQDKTVITVTGSHGKTTTTSLVSYLLTEVGSCPTVAAGGLIRNFDTNACLGNGEFFVAEADESDGSFLYYHPEYSIVTNIDREHLDYYRTFENAVENFKKFIQRTSKDGCVFACGDDPNLRSILKEYKNKHILYGLKEPADIYPRNIRFKGLSSEFDCFYKGKLLDRFYLNLGGAHNISNALAVIALGMELKIEPKYIKQALADYKGAGRRIEVRFTGSCTLIDDYAHHPTEIKATLEAVQNLKFRRLVAVFQPHRYSRTKLLLEDFSRSFDLADCLIITDIYAASETPIEGVSARLIYDKIKARLPEKELYYFTKEELAGQIIKMTKPDDLVVTLGAGDIGKICDELVEEFKRKSQACPAA